jgi:hypothetical protein
MTNHAAFQSMVMENAKLRQRITQLEAERDAMGTEAALANQRLEAAQAGQELVDLIRRIVA